MGPFFPVNRELTDILWVLGWVLVTALVAGGVGLLVFIA